MVTRAASKAHPRISLAAAAAEPYAEFGRLGGLGGASIATDAR